MNTYKQFEDAAAACRNTQIFVDECTKLLKKFEDSAAVRAKTFGMISAAIDSLTVSCANLDYCANCLYKAIDECEEK